MGKWKKKIAFIASAVLLTGTLSTSNGYAENIQGERSNALIDETLSLEDNIATDETLSVGRYAIIHHCPY